MSGWFEYESGHAWCESAYKYQTHPLVAEFANTITNLPIIVLPMLNAMLQRRYLHEVNMGLLFPQLLLTFNGLASTYYHATLNLFGGLVIRWTMILLTAFFSALCFLEPNLNAIVLMFFSIPAAFVIHYEGVHSGIPCVQRFPVRILTLWSAGFACWFADRLLCPLWLAMGTPYLHAAFHLLAGLAGYTIFIMFSMIDIETRREKHNFTAAVRYFPDKKGSIFSFPYISLKNV